MAQQSVCPKGTGIALAPHVADSTASGNGPKMACCVVMAGRVGKTFLELATASKQRNLFDPKRRFEFGPAMLARRRDSTRMRSMTVQAINDNSNSIKCPRDDLKYPLEFRCGLGQKHGCWSVPAEPHGQFRSDGVGNADTLRGTIGKN